MWHKEEMTTAANACVIIYNMIVSHRRHKNKGTQNIRLPEDDTRMPKKFALSVCRILAVNRQSSGVRTSMAAKISRSTCYSKMPW
jgi:hypothetical protein